MMEDKDPSHENRALMQKRQPPPQQPSLPIPANQLEAARAIYQQVQQAIVYAIRHPREMIRIPRNIRLVDALVGNVNIRARVTHNNQRPMIGNHAAEPMPSVEGHGDALLRIRDAEIDLHTIEIVSENSQCKSLDLFRCDIKNSAYELKNTNIVHLKIYDSIIDHESIKKLVSHQAFQSISFIRCSIDDAAAKVIAQYCKVPNLDLSGNEITAAITAELSGNHFITSLNLSDNHLGDDGAIAIFRSKSITSLDLSGNNITYGCLAVLLENNIIIILVIDRNKIGPQGARILSNHPSLMRLSLDENGIGDDGAIFLAKHYKGYWLSIGLNGITNEGGRHFIDNEYITTLLMEGNLIGNKASVLLAGNKRLSALGLYGNKLGKKAMNALKRNTTLTYLNVNGDPTLRKYHNNIWISLIFSQDINALHTWAWWSYCLNRVSNRHYNEANEQIKKNQRRAAALVDACFNKDRSQVINVTDAAKFINNASEQVLPYGQYIENQLNNGTTLLHMAVYDENIELIRLLKNNTPYSQLIKKDSSGLNYEEFATAIGFNLPPELSIASRNSTEQEKARFANNELRTQREFEFIDAHPDVKNYYIELKAYLITQRLGAMLVTRAGIVPYADIRARLFNRVIGLISSNAQAAGQLVADFVESRRRGTLEKWLSNEGDVLVLARRLAYLKKDDIKNKTYEQDRSAFDSFQAAFSSFTKGQQYTSIEILAFIDAKKIVQYAGSHEKTTEESDACINVLLEYVMGRKICHGPVLDAEKKRQEIYDRPLFQHPLIARNETPLHYVPRARVDNSVDQSLIKQLINNRNALRLSTHEKTELKNKLIQKERELAELKEKHSLEINEFESNIFALKKKNDSLENENAILEEIIEDLHLEIQNLRSQLQISTPTKSNGTDQSTVTSTSSDNLANNMQERLPKNSVPVMTVFFSFDEHRIVKNSQHPMALPEVIASRETHKTKTNMVITLNYGTTF